MDRRREPAAVIERLPNPTACSPTGGLTPGRILLSYFLLGVCTELTYALSVTGKLWKFGTEPGDLEGSRVVSLIISGEKIARALSAVLSPEPLSTM